MKAPKTKQVGLIIRVDRTDPCAQSHFKIDVGLEETLLSALIRLQEEQDSTLRFRYNCCSGQCGVCVVNANGKNVRSCDTRIGDIISNKQNHKNSIFLKSASPHATLVDLITDVHSAALHFINNLKIDSLERSETLKAKNNIESGWIEQSNSSSSETSELNKSETESGR